MSLCRGTYHAVRQLALPGVEEGTCFGTPSLYVRRKLMARLREDGETLVQKVAPADRAIFFANHPDTFFTTDHYRNYPVMLVNLLSIREKILRDVVEVAWHSLASAKMISAYDATHQKNR